jgi:hypothetical protein
VRDLRVEVLRVSAAEESSTNPQRTLNGYGLLIQEKYQNHLARQISGIVHTVQHPEGTRGVAMFVTAEREALNQSDLPSQSLPASRSCTAPLQDASLLQEARDWDARFVVPIPELEVF